MQAAARRAPAVKGHRRTDNLGANPHLVTADDTGLLDALPIAAAIIERSDPKTLRVLAHNSRFLVTVELDFRDGEGVSAHFFRLKLAPLPRSRGSAPRCLLSVVDRTVEVQAERTLRAEMLRDS